MDTDFLQVPEVYKSAAWPIKNLNVVTLLTAYQAQLFQEMSHLLDKGSQSLAVWDEICAVTSVSLHVSRGTVVWPNLSSFPEQDKQAVMDSPFDPSQAKGFLGETVSSMH